MEKLTVPGYYAVIPANVRYDDQLPANAKLMYGEISALIGKDGFCYASNAYFASLYQLTERTISKLISSLQDGNYIKLELERDATTKQILARKIYLNVSAPDGQPVEEKFYTPGKNLREGIEENFQDTNLSNTDICEESKKESSGKKTSKKKSVPAEDFDPMKQFTEWIGETLPDRPREEKNALYLALSRFCESRNENKHPIKSQGAVTALCNRLMQYSGGSIEFMVDMLDTATSSGWRSVYPPGGQKRDATAVQGRKWECL